MKKLITILALAGLACTTTLHAQTADPKTEWAAKVVALQQGPELDRIVSQLADGSAQDLIANWAPKLDANVPKAQQKKISEEMNAELKKYADDTSKLIGKHVNKVSAEVLVPAYVARFSLEELKQIAAFFESPAIKKYQATAPELGNVFIQKLIETSRADVQTRMKRFDDAAQKIIGGTATPKASTPAKK